MEVIIRTPRYELSRPQGQRNAFIIITQNEGTTDAEPGHEPSQRSPIRDANGAVNYYEEPDAINERLWREKLGKFIYNNVVREDLRRQGIRVSPPLEKVYLASFPLHYKLLVHKKGDPHDPRKDHYLYGSRFVSQFRSPPEFFLHLKWILEGQPMRDGMPNCRCCYCDPSRKQGDISKDLGIYHPGKRDRDRDGKGGKGGGSKGGSRSAPPAPVIAKDYTKLSTPTSS